MRLNVVGVGSEPVESTADCVLAHEFTVASGESNEDHISTQGKPAKSTITDNESA